MSNIGELFKVLNSNALFANYIKKLDEGVSSDEIITLAFADADLMLTLTAIVPDVETIKSKMKTVLGQKTKTPKKTTETSVSTSETTIKYFCQPFVEKNVTYLGDFAYIEPVEHRIRLVTTTFELYY